MGRYPGCYCKPIARVRLSVLFGLVWAVLVPCLAQSGFGPLRVGERNPLVNRFLSPRAERADLLPRGVVQLTFSPAFSNVFERQSNESFIQEIDLENLTLTLDGGTGLGGGWEVGGSIGMQSYFGGFLDAFIQEFHQTFDLPNDTRDEVPNGSYRYRLSDGSGSFLVDTPKGIGERDDTELYGKFKLPFWNDHSRAASLKLSLKLPTGTAATSSQRADWGLTFLFRRSWEKIHYHSTASLLLLNPPPVLEPIVNKVSLFLSQTVERTVARNLAVLVQLDGGPSLFHGTGLSNMDEPALNLTAGLAGIKGPWQWQLGFAEDLTGDGPAIDFTVHIALSRSFGRTIHRKP